MKKFYENALILLMLLCFGTSVFAYNIDSLRHQDPNAKPKQVVLEVKTPQTKDSQEMREIKNITEYFKYLPREVQRNWTPYKAETDYEVTVQFRVKRDGTIDDLHVVKTTLRDANVSVLNAVRSGAPYQPLPKSFEKNSVTAQIILEYRK